MVDRVRLGAVGPVRDGSDKDTLEHYIAAVEEAPATVQWKGFDEIDVQAQVAAGQSILLQETYDPAWHAYENGKPVPLRIEPVMNFMLIDLPEGAHAVHLRFETPLENRIGQGITLLGLAAVVGLAIQGLRVRGRQRGLAV